VTPFRAKAYNHCLDPECASNKMPELEVGTCPVCAEAGRDGKLMAQKNPRTLKRYIRCTNHELCNVSYPLPQRGELQATGEVCDTCGAPEVIVETTRGPWRICVNMNCPKREEEAKKKSTRGRKTTTRKKTTAKKSTAKKTTRKKS
jgi:DNA topoisomerase-1